MHPSFNLWEGSVWSLCYSSLEGVASHFLNMHVPFDLQRYITKSCLALRIVTADWHTISAEWDLATMETEQERNEDGGDGGRCSWHLTGSDPEEMLKVYSAPLNVLRMNGESVAWVTHSGVKVISFRASVTEMDRIHKLHRNSSDSCWTYTYAFLKFKCTKCAEPLGICIEIHFQSPDKNALAITNGNRLWGFCVISIHIVLKCSRCIFCQREYHFIKFFTIPPYGNVRHC